MKIKTVLFAAIAAGLVTGSAKPSVAVASWARRYNTSCSMCHRPAPPRLSFFGHQFRKRGYRLPDEVGAKPDLTNLSHYLSLRNRFRYNYSKPKGGNTTSQFELNDTTIFYSGPITGTLSAFVELERPSEPELEVQAFGEWTKGDVPKYWALRWGQMHTLSRVGWAGFDRPTGISAPWLLGRRLTTANTAFTIGQDQRGMEYQHSTNERGRVIAQILNGLNPGTPADIEGRDDTQKDLLGAWEQALNDVGSGFTLLGYRGSWETAPGGPRDTFTRFALTGDYFRYLFRPDHLTELQGGVGFAHDDVHGIGATNGRVWYIDLEQYLPHDAAVFARWDQLDPNRSIGGDTEHRITLGGVYDVSDSLRLALELASQKTFSAGIRTRTNSAVIEAMINF